MRKTLRQDFEQLSGKINIATHSPCDPCYRLAGKLVHNKGYFFVDKAPTADSLYRLRRVENAQGGLSNPLGVGPLPARELKGLMLAFLLGLIFNKGE